MKNKYEYKITSIIEILLGLAIGGFGGFIFLLSGSSPGPTVIVGFILGVPMMLLGIFLIIFGINLLKLKKWAWLASVVTLIIAIAFFIAFRAFSVLPIFISLWLGAIFCLMLLILGRIKEREISIPWKKILIIAVLIAVGAIGYLGYHWYQTSQRPAPPKELPVVSPTTEESVIRDETANWKVYRNEYSYEKDYWGYEIKYPPDWIMTEYEGVHQAKWTSPRTMLPPLREIFIETSGAFRHGGVYIDTINCTWSESQKEWFKKFPEMESKTYPFPIGKEKIGEIEFCKMQDIGGDEIGKIGGLGIRYVIYKNGWDYENTLWIYYYDISEGYEFQYELDIFKKMLSTFKFIEK